MGSFDLHASHGLDSHVSDYNVFAPIAYADVDCPSGCCDVYKWHLLDGDGHHICGLLCNLFGALWPDLMRQNVLYRLKTPVIVAKTPKESFEFFNLDEYREWEKKGIKHTPKYFKGLGSWKTSDFERFLSDEKYVTQIVADDEGVDMLEMVFGNEKGDDKKEWLK